MAEEASPNQNPNIEQQQPMEQDHTESTKQSQPNDNNDQDINDDLNNEDIDNIENIYHKRTNDVSENKIKPILNELLNVVEQEEPIKDTQNKPQKNTDNYADHEEKVNNIQKETILRMEHGHCSRQGMRPTMEDQVVVESTLNVFGSKCTSGQLSIYGVFDGHGGSECAEFCASHLIEILSPYLLSQDSVIGAFTLAISDLDEKVIESAKDASGSTCCIVLIDNKNYDLWCCNVGDSRCILINNECDKVKQVSIEHKPDYPLEKERIENANGWVTFGRVCGILAVSRSLGDKDFKYEIENLVISTPDVTHHKLVLNEDMFIVLACDGLFDVFSNHQCMEWMNKNKDIDLQELTQQLCHDAIHVRKSKDNVSILVLRIDHIQVEIEEEDDDEDEDINLNVNDFDKIYNGSSPNNNNIKHKFHVVMESDDNIQIEENNHDDVESK